ncbi:hypothetical protein BB560_004805 [Smittium megazygosporum]|uniref:DnaJ homolog 1, mitochondrial n=1 Tax=Smittium megazygosporum TaxID=133381 RepID=A0A2T9Z873_9FUNG|nr:hypothetical protein BB560_004805 [Smittium megazygosporum]
MFPCSRIPTYCNRLSKIVSSSQKSSLFKPTFLLANHFSYLSGTTTHPGSPTYVSKRHFHPSNISKDDLYERLGVPKDASTSEIKKKYYQLAKKYHPDVNKEPGAKEKFFKIQEAYDTLSDDNKRAQYDQFGTTESAGGYPGGAGGQGGFSGFHGFGGTPPSMDEIFSQIFGGGGFGGFRAGGPGAGTRGATNRGDFRSSGEDLTSTLHVSFEEAVTGVKKQVRIDPVLECDTCSGTGVKKGAKSTKCSTCQGTGRQTFSMGGFHVQQTCGSCGGTGSTTRKEDVCGSCRGRGVVQGRETISVDVPAGVDDGMVIEMPNYGDAPIDGKGPRGSLYIKIRVDKSDKFTRKGSNIFYTANVSLSQALLGGEITVPTVNGNVDVVIKPGTQPGDELRLRGRGMKKVKGFGNGDFYLQIKVEIPKNLTSAQRSAAQALSDALENKTSTPKPPPSPPPESNSDTKPNDSNPDSSNKSTHEGFFKKFKDTLNSFHKDNPEKKE